MPRALITPAVYANGQGPWREVLDAAGVEVVIPPVDCTTLTEAEFIAQLQGIDFTLASMERYTENVFAGSKLRAVARVGVGYDAVDVAAATRHGAAVCITPGTNEHSVAEQAIALITAVFRDTCRRDREIRGGKWRRDCPRRLAGNTIGLVGLGRIGRAMTPRCQGLGLKVIAYDPYADAAFAAQRGIELVSFHELLAQADIVSLHMPCTPETTDIINAKTLALMKPNSTLINTSRGGLVDEDALCDALASGHLFGAGLDVCKTEPLPALSRLRQFDNLVFAPHLGGIDQDALDAMGRLAAQCLVDLSQNRWPTGCVVNETLRAGWSW
ncbi:phosphoglycerate dehydrogenase [Anatilimnocola floriformis]|uniref:phosphoglycerate dehydrogenase n=1 Tax=Anatilimnocola floriformis TaxID=2948575 RepID=UPI0020C537BF|nr:phosphoglycerate dehydrogenase [Anatilimnocola floriformis]